VPTFAPHLNPTATSRTPWWRSRSQFDVPGRPAANHREQPLDGFVEGSLAILEAEQVCQVHAEGAREDRARRSRPHASQLSAAW
jgi:hypothetical protein